MSLHILGDPSPWFSRNVKPAKWHVHRSYISETLRAKGVFGNLTEMPLLCDKKLDRCQVTKTYEVRYGAEEN